MNGNLDDVARYIGATGYEDLRWSAYIERETWNPSEKKTYVNDLFIEHSPPA